MSAIRMTREVTRLLNEPLGVLGLSVRTVNALEEAGLMLVEDLLNVCPGSSAGCVKYGCPCRRKLGRGAAWRPSLYLFDVPNLGSKTYAEIQLVVRKSLSEAGAFNTHG